VNAYRKRGGHAARGEAEAVARFVARLRQQFPELLAEVIEDTFHRRHEGFDGHPVRDFVPILVERAAREDLITRHRA
jgi:hypothetical protein